MAARKPSKPAAKPHPVKRMSAAGPTRAEAMLDALSVVRADYTKVMTKVTRTCPDCAGAGFVVGDKKARGKEEGDSDSDGVNHCYLCDGQGKYTTEEFDAEAMPDELRVFVTGYKTGPGGTILPEMRNKDKNATEVIKMLGNGWATAFPRDAFGSDAPAEGVRIDSKDAIIAQYERIAMSADATLAMAALREISKLRGFITEENDEIDTVPMDALTLQQQLAEIVGRPGRSGDLPPEILPE